MFLSNCNYCNAERAQGAFYFLSDDWILNSFPQLYYGAWPWALWVSKPHGTNSHYLLDCDPVSWPLNSSILWNLFLNCSFNANLHFYWSVMYVLFLFYSSIKLKVIEVIWSPTLHFTISLLFRHSHRSVVTTRFLEEAKPPLVVMHPLSALPSCAPMRWLQN